MRLFNSLDQKIREVNEKVINIYLCGPTVYNYIHIGNARPIIIFDVLTRLLTFLRRDFFYVQNLTDIDDKIIERALIENCTEKEISEKYINAYFNDLNNLQILRPSLFVKVSDYINPMIEFVNKLLLKKVTYEVNGNVYFDLNKYSKQYGKLAKKDIVQNIAGARIDIDKNKINNFDFALWKKTDIGQKWKSYWSLGRPGWHTECAFFINHLFKNKPITIHGGGIDLIFPHHENERIQLYALNEKEPVKIWMHNGHLNWKDNKMSKSGSNYILVRDFLNQYDSNILKYLLLSAPYRRPLNITDELIKSSQKIINSYYELNKQFLRWSLINQLKISDFNIDNNIMNKITSHLEDDLNIAKALTEIQNLTKILKQSLKQNNFQQTMVLFKTWKQSLWLLSIEMFWPEIDEQIEQLIIEWQSFRDKQNYQQADQIMIQLKNKGFF